MASWQCKVVKITFWLQRFRGRGEYGVDVAAERERYESQLVDLSKASTKPKKPEDRR